MRHRLFLLDQMGATGKQTDSMQIGSPQLFLKMIDKNRIYSLDENLPEEFWEGLDPENDWDVFKLKKRVALHNRKIQRGNSVFNCEKVLKKHGIDCKVFPENGQINVYKDDRVFVYYSTTGTINGYKQKGFKAFCKLLGI